MKKFRILLVGSLATCLTVAAFAANKKEEANNANKKKANAGQIIVYSAPDTKKILEKLPGNAVIIPIYRQKEWVKIGDPKNGKVGWVNKEQVSKARQAFYRPDIQTIYIHADRNAKGKPQFSIVAFRNGEKLSPSEAKRLYEKMRKSQMREMKRVRYMTHWMNEEFYEAMPPAQPMIVLPAAKAASDK